MKKKNNRREVMDLDSQIAAIQQSTRTSMKTFLPIHDWLRERSRLYYSWHTKPYAGTVHWSTAFSTIIMSVSLILPLIFSSYFQTLAAPQTWTQTTQSDFNTGTKNGTVVANTDGGEIKLASGTFSNKKVVTITNTDAVTLTDYQVKVDLNSANFDFSKTRTNGEDIRFLDSNDTTPLNYWIENWNAGASTASIWVKVPSIAASSSHTINMYYGNPDIQSASSSENTFIEFSDFDNSSGWTNSAGGTGSVTYSSGDVTVSAGNDYAASYRYFATSPTNSVIELKYRHSDGAHRIRIQLTDVNGTNKMPFDNGVFDNQIYWNGWTGAYLSAGSWYTIRYTLSDSNVEIRYLDASGNTVYSSSLGSRPAGIVRFQILGSEDANSIAVADWFRLRAYTATTPTVTIGSIVPDAQPSSAVSGWSYRTPIIINNTSGSELTDYQISTTFDAQALVDDGKLRSDGNDFRFTDSDGTTLIPYYLDGSVSRQTHIYIKVPSIGASTTKTIYAYFGKSDATAGSSTSTFTGTVSPIAEAAWTLNESSGTTAADATGNNHTGTVYNNPTIVAGRSGNAKTFGAASNKYIAVDPIGLDSFTVSAWVMPSESGSGSVIDDELCGSVDDWGLQVDTDKVQLQIGSNDGNDRYYKSTNTLPIGQWSYIAATRNASNGEIKIYINGVQDGTTATAFHNRTVGLASPGCDGYPNKIGIGNDYRAANLGAGGYKGTIDEPRIYKRVLSDSELALLGGTGKISTYLTDTSSEFVLNYTATPPSVTITSASKIVTNASGTYVSTAFDTNQISDLSNISWNATIPQNSSLKFKIRTAASSPGLDNATWYGPTSADDFYTSSGTAINSTNDTYRWIQVKAYLNTESTSINPSINSVSVGYDIGNQTISANTSAGADGETYTVHDLTIDSGSTYSIAGGTTLNVTGRLTVTGNSTLLLMGKNKTSASSGAGVTLHAQDVQVDSGSKISAAGEGYSGNNCSGAGYGPGGGNLDCNNNGIAGTHGGYGARNGKALYGNQMTPTDLGSGGSGAWSGPSGGNGGGAIRLIVDGSLVLNGTVTVNGNDAGCGGVYGTCPGAGAGGSIYATIGSLSGDGVFTANGGAGGSGGYGGGGGRVAVYYTSGGLTTPANTTANGGSATGIAGTAGTVILSNNSHLIFYQPFTFPNDTVATYDIVDISNGATVSVGGGSNLTITSNLNITNGSTMLIKSKNNSALIDSQWQGLGGAVHAGNVWIDSTSHLSADGQGYLGTDCNSPGKGPGGAYVNCNNNGVGGAYGGQGSNTGNGSLAGTIYGNALIPTELGSGGSGGYQSSAAGAGGGYIRLIVDHTANIEGVISASGADGGCGGQGCNSGGGSGGSLYITTSGLVGGGYIKANGGNPQSDRIGGGGGRVAVYYTDNHGVSPNVDFNLSNVTAAAGHVAGAGTVYLVENGNLTVSATLTMPENTTLDLNNITINNGATFTLGGGSIINLTGTLAVEGNSQMVIAGKNVSSLVNGSWQGVGSTIHTADLRVDQGSSITADSQGYSGSDCNGAGKGTGGGQLDCNNSGVGGTYGGKGARSSDSILTYGSVSNPTDLGSGGSGGYAGTNGGAGGGAVILTATGTATINGTISANGQTTGCGTSCGGGGSGGTVNLTVGALTGSGSVSANGGNASQDQVGGGGGRIKLSYTTNSGFPLANVNALGGTGATSGTTYLVSNGVLTVSTSMTFDQDSNINLAGILVNNGSTLNIGGGSTINLSGEFRVTQNSTVNIFGKNTASRVNGEWGGVGVTIHANSVMVESGSTVTADARGYAGNDCNGSGVGPGGGQLDCNNTGVGGTYGGKGARSSDSILAYGSVINPTDLGSGGSGGYGGTVGGAGGGAIIMTSTNTFTVNGTITADGQTTGCGTSCGGGGSGGSINIRAGSFTGSGVIKVNGGNASQDQVGGGGGRIAVRYYGGNHTGMTITANGGTNANNGTVSVHGIDTVSADSPANGVVTNGFPVLTSSQGVFDPDGRTMIAHFQYVKRSDANCNSETFSGATTVISDNSGSWSGNGQYSSGSPVSYHITSQLTPGYYCWRATARGVGDVVEDIGTWSPLVASFIVDTGSPTVSINLPNFNNQYFSNQGSLPSSLTGTVSDDQNGQGILADSVVLLLQRASDGQYWSGKKWLGSGTNTIKATNSATTGSATTTWSTSSLPNWTEDTYYLTAQAKDKAGNSTDAQIITFTYDQTGPALVSAVYDGSVTGVETSQSQDLTTLSANWPATTDSVSGIDRYQYSIGTTSGGNNVVDWTNNGTNLSFTKTGLSLTAGQTYYISVRSFDKGGNVSGVKTSSGVTIASSSTNSTPTVSESPSVSPSVSTSASASPTSSARSSQQPTASPSASASVSPSTVPINVVPTTVNTNDLVQTTNAPTVVISSHNVAQTLTGSDKVAHALVNDPISITITPVNTTNIDSATFRVAGIDIPLVLDADGNYHASVLPPTTDGSYLAEAEIHYKDGTLEKRQIALLVDPFGYVYEKTIIGQTRLKDATVTLKVKNGEVYEVWNGESTRQVNPQITTDNGEYAYFVPSGTYQISATKTGYKDFVSNDISVNNAPIAITIEMHRLNTSFFGTVGETISGITQNVVAAVKEIASVATESVKVAAIAIHDAVAPIADNPITQTSTTTATTVTAAVVATSVAIPIASNLPLLDLGGHILASLAALVAPKKKKNKLGVVIDTENGQPVSGAVVRILESETKKVLETQVTDISGSFGFLVDPGHYLIEVIKPHYHFPSQIIKDEYHGELITLSRETPLQLTIPIDPELTVLSSRLKAMGNFHQWLNLVRLPLLAIGTVLNLIVLVGSPDAMSLIVGLLYLFVWAYEIYKMTTTAKATGLVVDINSNKGVELAIVRLQTEQGKLISSKVSNQHGHFLVQTAPGYYRVTVTHQGYQQLSSDWLTKKHDTLSRNFRLRPENTMPTEKPSSDSIE